MEDELALAAAQNEYGMLHGVKVCKYLVQPRAFSDRLVSGDSYFVSVPTAKELKSTGLCFIGVVNTATRMHLMPWLSNAELQNRGDWKALMLKDENGVTAMMVFVWMDVATSLQRASHWRRGSHMYEDVGIR